MNVLICNDDGIRSKRLIALAKELNKKYNVLVVAPSKNKSACAHTLSVCKKIKLKKVNFINGVLAYSLSGSPADCVKFASHYFSDFKIDLVVSGVNNGHNLGTDILYSGTLSAAIEGSFFGYKSIALSCVSHDENDVDFWTERSVEIIEKLIPLSENGRVWNVNFPDVKPNDLKGTEFVALGQLLYNDYYKKVGINKYVLEGTPIDKIDNIERCDVEFSRKGYITITPILFDKTDYNKLKECEKL